MLFPVLYTLHFATFAIRTAADLVSQCTQLRVDSYDPGDGVILGKCVDYNSGNSDRLAMIEQSECLWVDQTRVIRAGYTGGPDVWAQFCSSCYLAPPTGIGCYCKNSSNVWDWTNQLDLNEIIWIDGDGNFNCNPWPNNSH